MDSGAGQCSTWRTTGRSMNHSWKQRQRWTKRTEGQCMAHATIRPAAPPSASATGLSAAPRWERLRDHGHGRRPSPTQTAPRGGRSRDYLVGGGRSASHVPYPDLAGRHRGQAAIGATGVTGAALNSLFYRSRVQRRAVVTAEGRPQLDSMVGSRTHTPRTPLRSCRDRGVWLYENCCWPPGRNLLGFT